jgi:hypothetical protein
MNRGGNWWFKISTVLLVLSFVDSSLTHMNLGWGELTLKRNWCYDWLFFYSYFWTSASALGVIYAAITLVISWSLFSGGGCFALLALYLLDLKVHTLDSFWCLPTANNYFIINSLLTNRLNYVHPPLFFISILLLAWGVLCTGQFHSSALRGYFGRISVRDYFWWEKEFTFVLTPLITLGGWWAYQEGNWGGWWNWDPSETFAFLLTLRILFLWHNYTPFISTNERFLSGLNNSLILLCIFLFIQINFAIVSHNFGLRFLSFFSTSVSLSFWVLLFLCVYFSISRVQILLFYTRRLGGVLKKNLTFLMYILWVLYSTYSFAPIFTYFSWNAGGVVIASATPHIDSLNVFCITIFTFFFARFSKGLAYSNWLLFGWVSYLSQLSLLLGSVGSRPWFFYVHMLVAGGFWWCAVSNLDEHWFITALNTLALPASWDLLSNFADTFSRWDLRCFEVPQYHNSPIMGTSQFFFLWEHFNLISSGFSVQGVSWQVLGSDVLILALLPSLIWVIFGLLLKRW